MAVITPSSLISEIRGKVGQLFYSRNAHGAFVGEWVVPSNPQTEAQQNVRTGLANGANAWNSLSQYDRQVWLKWAEEQINALSISRKPTKVAKDEYVGRWVNRAVINGSNSSINPYTEKPSLASYSIEIDGIDDLELNYTLNGNHSNIRVVVSSTAPLSNGVSNPGKSDFRVTEVLTPSSSTDSSNIFSAIQTRWGISGADIGKAIWVQVWLIDATDYTASVKQVVKVNITDQLVSAAPFIAQSSVTNAFTTGNVTGSFPSTPHENSLLFAFTSRTNGANNTPPAGWSALHYSVDSTASISTFYKIATAAETNSYAFTGVGTGNITLTLLEIRNVDTINPINDYDFNSAIGATSILAGAGNLDMPANSLALVGVGLAANSAGWSINNFFGSLIPGATASVFQQIASRTYLSADTGENATMSWATARRAVSQLIVINSP